MSLIAIVLVSWVGGSFFLLGLVCLLFLIESLTGRHASDLLLSAEERRLEQAYRLPDAPNPRLIYVNGTTERRLASQRRRAR